MEQLVKLYRESHLSKRLPAYDGRKSLYTAGPLPFQSKEFKITLLDDDDGQPGQKYVLTIFFILVVTFLFYFRSLLYDVFDDGFLLDAAGERGNSEL